MSNISEVTRQFKSNSFSLLLQEKKYALQVYNALNRTNYSDPNIIELAEVVGGVLLTVRNDATFFIENRVNIYEHQSTPNPNMPLRMLLYIADVYKYYIKKNDLNIYGSTLIKLPVPKFVVFYNGKEKQSEKETMRLSDAFTGNSKDGNNEEYEMELVCTCININPGYNEELKNCCPALSGYTTYVERVRENRKQHMELPAAVEAAVNSCIEDGILGDFFMEYRSLIVSADALDYTMEARVELAKKDVQREFSVIINNKDKELAEKDSKLAEKDRIIAELEEKLKEKK